MASLVLYNNKYSVLTINVLYYSIPTRVTRRCLGTPRLRVGIRRSSFVFGGLRCFRAGLKSSCVDQVDGAVYTSQQWRLSENHGLLYGSLQYGSY